MLSGIRVVSFTHFLQGPSASQMLADLGADVIKIEPKKGAFERSWTGPGRFLNGHSPFFALGNRNVRSMVVDLKSPAAVEPLLALLDTADVLVESFRPGTLDRFGLGWEALHERNPRLVYASLSGYGSDGPYVDRPGQDVLVQALSGIAMATGREADPPQPVGACIVDQHAAVLGAMGILAALHGRERSGEGVKVESNLLNAALDLQIEPLTYAMNGFEGSRSASGVSSPFYSAPYGVFATSDGWICVSLTAPEQLRAVFDDEWFLGVDAASAFARREEVNERIADHMATRATSEWRDAFSAAGLWWAPVNGHDEVLRDPQVRHNDSFDSYEHADAGEVKVLKHPVRYDGVRPGIRSAPPELGAHTREVLGELGYSAEQIDALLAAKAVA